MLGLILGQAMVAFCDVTMATMLYLNLYLARKLVLPLNYALKVLIEYLVLNQLVQYSSRRARNGEVLIIENNCGRSKGDEPCRLQDPVSSPHSASTHVQIV